ncbi:unnamed protein product [Cuscuta campestris]|uniref:DNA-directed RNA polymerase subunit n=1 Tax=Cuscuta campestris TaxID=132261 RepID=A0A484MBA0_9ASTE|nr:unnamed protein product [Cuscuta campestris]
MIKEFGCEDLVAFPLDVVAKTGGQIRTSAVVIQVLQNLRRTGAHELCGYFLSVTKFISIGAYASSLRAYSKQEFVFNGGESTNFCALMVVIGTLKLLPLSKIVIIPVKYNFRSFLPTPGEKLVGIIRRVFPTAVLLSCGPMNVIYLHQSKMPGYKYVGGDAEKPAMFQRDDLTRIEKDAAVRFKVLDARWSDVGGGLLKREFKILASIEGDAGDSLGPVAVVESDGSAADFPCFCPPP